MGDDVYKRRQDAAIKRARLAEVRRKHAKQGNYTTFRNGRPYLPRVNRRKQQLKEHLLMWSAAIFLIVCAGLAGSGGF